jgi:hypothetical protein
MRLDQEMPQFAQRLLRVRRDQIAVHDVTSQNSGKRLHADLLCQAKLLDRSRRAKASYWLWG